MADNIHSYRNVTTGDVFIVGVERPDLDARANFERVDVDVDLLDPALREQLQVEAEAAKTLAASAKTIENQQTEYLDDPAVGTGGINMPRAEAAEFLDPAVANKPLVTHGVLSRNITTALHTQAELRVKAAADTEALAMHGVLADQIDGSQTRVEVEAINMIVENAEAIGDTKDSPIAKQAAASRKSAARKGATGAGSGATGGGSRSGTSEPPNVPAKK